MECLDDNAVIAYVEHLLEPAARARIAAHLDECDACLAITCATVSTADGTSATAATIAATDAPSGAGEARRGDSIGRYSVIEMIGRGAMGAVYLAHDPQLDRRVALKLVRSPRFAQPQVRARLSREARAMARVTHPHVVTVYDAGELADGVFIAMELVEGTTLEHWLETPRPWRERVRAFVAVGRGLAAAHAAGIVHRDFKPQNVLVDRAGRVAVTDFGLAQAPATTLPTAPEADAVDATPLAEAHELTRTGALLGTPRFMSPEQFRAEAVSDRSDQFSFAVALWATLYGAYPFAGATIGELRAQVIAPAPPVPPVGARVPRRIQRALQRALATDPAARYPGLAPLLAELEAAARPDRRVALIAGGLAVLGVATAAVLLTASDGPAPHPAIVTPLPLPGQRTGEFGRVPVFIAPFANRTGDPRLDDVADLAVEAVLLQSRYLDPVAGVELTELAADAGGAPTAVNALAAFAFQRLGRTALTVHGTIDREGRGYRLAVFASGDGRPPFYATADAASEREITRTAARLSLAMRAYRRDPPTLGDREQVLSPSIDAVHALAVGEQLGRTGDQAGAGRRVRARDRQRSGLRRGALGARSAPLQPGRSPRLDPRAGACGRRRGAHARAAAPAHARRLLRRDRPLSRGDRLVRGDAREVARRQPDRDQRHRDGDRLGQLAARAVARAPRPGRARRAAGGAGEPRADRAGERQARRRRAARHGDARGGHAGVGVWLLLRRDRGGAARRPGRGAAGAGLARRRRRGGDRRLRARDLAAYEGRLDDAAALLRRYIDPAIRERRAHDGDRRAARAGDDPAARRRSGRGRACRAARDGRGRAALGVRGGQHRPRRRADRRRRGRRSRRGTFTPSSSGGCTASCWRATSRCAQGRPRDAIAAYLEAGRVAPSWFGHERLGRAYLLAHAWADAERELTWCLDHRGEAPVYLTPGLVLLPEVIANLARAKEGRGAPADELRAAYQAVVALAPAAQHDPVTEWARTRLR